jgi:uncharacterized protein with HEPN domain
VPPTLADRLRHVRDAITDLHRILENKWQRMADFGNRLRHAYHRVDPDILWLIAKNDLAPLQAFVERMIREEDPNGP